MSLRLKITRFFCLRYIILPLFVLCVNTCWASSKLILVASSIKDMDAVDDGVVEWNRDWLGIIIFLLLIIISFLIYYFQKRISNYKNAAINLNIEVEKHKTTIKQLEEVKDFNKRLISIISHDVRAPIASVDTFIKMQEAGHITQDEFNSVRDSISTQLSTIVQLLDNLLQWSKSSMLNRHEARQPLVLAEIIDANIRLVKPIATAKAIQINATLEDTLKIDVVKSEIDTVVRNLLSNAIKYTLEDGSIHVKVSSKNRVVYIEIADTGIGMTEAEVKRIFEMGVRESSLGTKGESGSGIGLLFCKEFVDKNGGKIEVSSKKHFGTTFTLSFPEYS